MERSKLEEIKLHKKLAKGYESKREKNKLSSYYNKVWLKTMLDVIDRKPKNILDYGCGTCLFYQGIKKRFNNSDYTGVDISQDMLNIAKKRYGKIRLICGDCENLPIKKESFDFVIGRGILHHLPNPKKGVSEIQRVLKKDGYAVICDTTKNPIFAILRNISKKTGHFSKTHKSFKKTELHNLFKANNLKIVKRIPWGFLAYPFAFPDIIEFKFMPYIIFKMLVKIDLILSKIPIINNFSWQEIILAKKV